LLNEKVEELVAVREVLIQRAHLLNERDGDCRRTQLSPTLEFVTQIIEDDLSPSLSRAWGSRLFQKRSGKLKIQ
jgi:hypothetical protein